MAQTLAIFKDPVRPWIGSAVFTGFLLALVTFAITERVDNLEIVVLVSVIGATGFFYYLFPGSHFFAVIFANLLVLYLCAFVFLLDANFNPITEGTYVYTGFALPIASFLVGAWWKRREIRLMVNQPAESQPKFRASYPWLLPVLALVALSFLLPDRLPEPVAYKTTFLILTVFLAVIVFLASAPLCKFLLYTGNLFADFFQRVVYLAAPALAFLTLYSLNVIVFASTYRILDEITNVQHFLVGGEPTQLSFIQSIYFSLVTLATVGYGDITPISHIACLLTGLQMISGVLLLLFGFAEIMSYSRRAQHDDSNAGHGHNERSRDQSSNVRQADGINQN